MQNVWLNFEEIFEAPSLIAKRYSQQNPVTGQGLLFQTQH